MSLYRGYNLDENAFDEMDQISQQEMNEYVSLIAYDDITHVDDASIREVCEGPMGEVLEAENIFNTKTRRAVSKSSDKVRRTKLIAYSLAKAKDDTEWKKMIKYRKLWKQSRDKIMTKYGRQASKIAEKAQREYIKRTRTARPEE